MTRVVLPLALTMGVQAIVSMATLTAPVLAPVAAHDLAMDATLVGVFVGIIYAGAMVSSLASGDLVLRYGAIRCSQVALVLCGIGLGISTTGTVAGLIAGAALIGLGYGPVTPASSHILYRTTPAKRLGLVLSLKQTGVPLGGAMAGGILPSLTTHLGWRGATLSVAATALILAVVVQLIRPALDADRDPRVRIALRGIGQTLRLVLGAKQLRDLALCSLVFGAMQLIVSTYLVAVMTGYGMSLVAAGLCLTAAQAAGVGGRLFWGWLADHAIPATHILGALACTTAVCSFGFAALTPAWPISLVVAIAMVFGATAIGWNGVFLAELAKRAPKGSAASVTGGALFITYSGVVIGPPVFAVILTWSGTGSSVDFTTGFTAFGAVVFATGLYLFKQSTRGTQPNGDKP